MKHEDVIAGGKRLASGFNAASDPQTSCVVSARVSHSERALLQSQAAGLSMSDFIRQRLLNENSKPRRTRGKFPVKDHEALARVLGRLG